MATASPAPAVTSERDLRLDLFRGIALWLIFLDHIPENIVNWFTIRNYGFSDATEIFIFISGYTAAFVYGRAMRERGFRAVQRPHPAPRLADLRGAHFSVHDLHGGDRLRRGDVRQSALRRGNEDPRFSQAAGHHDLSGAVVEVQAGQHGRACRSTSCCCCLFPPMLYLLLRRPNLALAGSAVVYALAWKLDCNLPAYPNGVWFFNPFAWQLLFVFGAWCALGGAQRLAGVLRSRVVLGDRHRLSDVCVRDHADLALRIARSFRADAG